MSIFFRDTPPPRKYMTGVGSGVIAVILLLFGVILVQNVVGVWPDRGPFGTEAAAADTAATAGAAVGEEVPPDTMRFSLLFPVGEAPDPSWDFRLLFITILFGALGSWVHAVSSYVRFTGNRQLVSSWTMWYVMRPLIGAGLAVVFYVVIRAGFATTGGANVGALSAYTVGAFAALVGLFTQQASEKLADVFDALFSPRDPDRDADPLQEDGRAAAAPTIESVSPRWIETGGTPAEVTVRGTNFTEDVTVTVNGAPVPEKDVNRPSATQLSFNLDPSYRTAKGTVEVVVKTSAGASEVRRIAVTPSSSGAPTSSSNG